MSLSSLEIREAILGDEAELIPMMRALAQQDPEVIPFSESAASAAFHQLLFLSDFGRVWLFYDGSELVGYIISTLGFSFEFRGHDAFVDELYIVPSHRRRGLGRQAMTFVEQKALKMGVIAMHLEVDPCNDSALELYRRTGYKDHNRFLMTKWLKRDKCEP